MEQFFSTNPVWSILILFSLAEQMFAYLMTWYPYSLGFKVQALQLPNARKLVDDGDFRVSSAMARSAKGTSRVYLHDRIPFGTLAPLVFIAEVKLDDSDGVTIIRLVPILCVLVVYTILRLGAHSITILLVFIFFYFRFYNNYRKLLKEFDIDNLDRGSTAPTRRSDHDRA